MKKATKINLALLALTLSANGLYAQQGFGTKAPNKASVIDMTSGTKGLLVPRVALTSTAIFAPVSGVDSANQHTANSLLVYNTATTAPGSTAVSPGYYYWQKPTSGSTGTWKRLLANDDASALALAGDVTGTLGANVVGKIQGIPVTNTTPTTNQVLTYNGAAWTPTAITPSTISGKADLSVTDGIRIATGSGTGALLNAATVGITDKGIAPIKITPGTNGQVLTTSGTETVWADKSSLITGVSNNSSGNSLTTTVNGVTGTGVNIINSNVLSLNSSNQLVSTVNGEASTALNLGPAIKAGETLTSLSQDSGTGVITYSRENATNQTANVRSAATGNLITYNGGAFLDATAVKNIQQNTIVQGTGAITVPAATVSGNNTTYTVGVVTATNTGNLGVVKQAATNPSVNVAADGTLSVNTGATGIGKTLTGSGITVTAGSTAGTGTSLANTVLADVTLGIADNAVNSAKIANGSIQGEDLNTNVAGNGLTQAAGGALQVNTYNGIKVNTTGTYNDHVGLGGALNEATTITATATNTLAIAGLQPGGTGDKIVVADTNGVLRSVDRSTFSADVRRIRTNHISEDAGTGGNGTAIPGEDNIAIGAGAMSAAVIGTHPLGFFGNIAIGGGNQLGNIASPGNVAIGYGNLPVSTAGINMAIGAQNLDVATTADMNYAFGLRNMRAITTGGSNLAMGANNLTKLTSGVGNNYAFGFNTLQEITTEGQNIAMGAQTLQKAKGEKNIGIGNSVLEKLGTVTPTTGNDNVGLGVASGGALTTGSYNTFFGTEAGNRLTGADASTVQYTSGNYGLFLGSQTKAKNTGDNQLNIGNWIYGENGNIALGNFNGATALPTITSTTRLDVVSGNVRIGTINANAGTTAHRMVVADADGVLKTVAQTSVAIEPWNIQSGTVKATANTDNIYQMGSVAIGKNAVTTHTASGTSSKFDVEGAVRIGQFHGGTVGTNSLATGLANSAAGAYSFVSGSNNIASGQQTFVSGNGNTGSATNAAALGGTGNIASGINSATLGGNNLTSAGFSEIAAGQYNAIATAPAATALGTTSTERNERTLLQIGNGSTSARNNALTLTQSGRLGVGITGADNNALPTQTLDVGNGNVRVRDINATTNTGAVADRSVVADVNGVLKTVKQAPRFFYMPAVIFDTSVSGTYTRDLYEEYRKQFEGNSLFITGENNNTAVGTVAQRIQYTGGIISSNSAKPTIAVYQRNELTYYITYYDQTAFSATGLTIASDGKLTYTVQNNAPSYAYMNIVFVVNE